MPSPKVSSTVTKAFSLRLRYPYWATKMDIKVNGKKVKAVKGADGYVAISRLWKAGDKIEVQLGMQLREEATKSVIFFSTLGRVCISASTSREWTR